MEVKTAAWEQMEKDEARMLSACEFMAQNPCTPENRAYVMSVSKDFERSLALFTYELRIDEAHNARVLAKWEQANADRLEATA